MMALKDKAERAAYHRAYYRRNKVVINSRLVAINRRRRHKRYEDLHRLKSDPCMDCGKNFPHYVMDFDHRDPAIKRKDVSALVKRMVTWGSVLEEIAKCDLVCACCHRLRTYEGGKGYKTLRFRHHSLILDRLKSDTACLDCGGFFMPCQMDFDHVQKGAKKANIARLVGSSTEVLVQEIAKCHLVCANCHRVRGFTGIRRVPSQSVDLVARFKTLVDEIPMPRDARFNKFPLPHLLGKTPDKQLAQMTGFSKHMVGWFRRRAGIKLTRTRAA
jgi:hypothetical protein